MARRRPLWAVPGAGGLAGDGDARGEKGAFVTAVLGGDAFRDGLRALEVGGRVEMGALPAAVEFGGAFRAGLIEVKPGGQRGYTIVATASGHVLHRLGQSRRGDIHGKARRPSCVAFRRGATILAGILTIFTFPVHMTMLLIFRWERRVFTAGVAATNRFSRSDDSGRETRIRETARAEKREMRRRLTL